MTKFVAEFTTNHMGNLNVLLRMTEEAAKAGCSLIKMQKKDVETFYSKEKLDAPYESPYGKTYRDYRSIFEFGAEDYARFDRKCKEMGVGWFSTVQDIPSLHFMLQFDVSTFKIASSNARNRPLLEECARVIPTTKELVISVAGSTPQQIEEALAIFPSHKIWLLHCVAQYPCPVDKLRLGNIGEMRRRFASDRVRIGYSGHEEGVTPSLAAVAMGAEMVERHFCLSRHSFVHHIECSLEPDDFRLMVDSATSPEKIEAARASLPATAFENHFGMTEREKSFLVEQTYGNRYLHEGSELPAPPRTGGVGKAA
ncbi:MAG TPA: N-acetylneuraminate synthase family protein [Polyangia bacterium]|jgi:N-acetylneuraminate synthase|nr:N-acetylneuraminate synthase family protein [Polyangia bacterium]